MEKRKLGKSRPEVSAIGVRYMLIVPIKIPIQEGRYPEESK